MSSHQTMILINILAFIKDISLGLNDLARYTKLLTMLTEISQQKQDFFVTGVQIPSIMGKAIIIWLSLPGNVMPKELI